MLNNRTLIKRERQSLERSFSVFMAVYPILCLYLAFSSFTIGDVLLIIFFLMFVYKRGILKVNTRTMLLGFFVVYAVSSLLINCMLTDIISTHGTEAVLWRMIKYVFYVLAACMVGAERLDVNVFKKTLFAAASLSCAFLFVQYVLFYGANIVVTGEIPGLTWYLSEYSEIDYEHQYSQVFRPCSIFLEPALFSHYTIVALIFTLFDHTGSMQKPAKWRAILFTVGIVMSTAGQGIAFLAVVYCVYIVKELKGGVRKACFGITIVCVALYAYNNIEVFQRGVDRLLFNDDAAGARLDSYHYCFEMEPLHFLFGNGYGVTPDGEYLAGAAYIWYGCGIIGLMLVFLCFGTMYRKASNNASQMCCIIFFVMFFATALFYNYMVYWFFSIIMMKNGIQKQGAVSNTAPFINGQHRTEIYAQHGF